MNEFPVFVPSGAEHVACVLTVPDGPPAGLWVLMPGISSPRSTHFHFPLWTEVARRLADRGIASVRLDHVGVGDSTGHIELLEPGPARVEDVLAVTRFAISATGVSRVGMAGSCYGGRLALETALRVPECVAAIAAHTAPRVDPAAIGSVRKLRHRVGRWGPVARLFRTTFGRKVLKPTIGMLLGRNQGPTGQGREPDLELRTLVGRARVLFVSGDDEPRYAVRLKPFLDRLLPTLPADLAGRIECQLVPGSQLGGYMTFAGQMVATDLIVRRAVEDTIGSVDPPPRPAAAPRTPAGQRADT